MCWASVGRRGWGGACPHLLLLQHVPRLLPLPCRPRREEQSVQRPGAAVQRRWLSHTSSRTRCHPAHVTRGARGVGREGGTVYHCLGSGGEEKEEKEGGGIDKRAWCEWMHVWTQKPSFELPFALNPSPRPHRPILTLTGAGETFFLPALQPRTSGNSRHQWSAPGPQEPRPVAATRGPEGVEHC